MTSGPRSAIEARGVLLVAAGGAVGAACRWAVVAAAGAQGTFPWWTLTVNLAGCFVLGLLVRRDPPVTLLVGVGFCGGLTTFSTFSVEVATLLDDGATGTAGAYLTVSVVAGVAAVLAGRRLAHVARVAGARR